MTRLHARTTSQRFMRHVLRSDSMSVFPFKSHSIQRALKVPRGVGVVRANRLKKSPLHRHGRKPNLGHAKVYAFTTHSANQILLCVQPGASIDSPTGPRCPKEPAATRRMCKTLK